MQPIQSASAINTETARVDEVDSGTIPPPNNSRPFAMGSGEALLPSSGGHKDRHRDRTNFDISPAVAAGRSGCPDMFVQTAQARKAGGDALTGFPRLALLSQADAGPTGYQRADARRSTCARNRQSWARKSSSLAVSGLNTAMRRRGHNGHDVPSDFVSTNRLCAALRACPPER